MNLYRMLFEVCGQDALAINVNSLRHPCLKFFDDKLFIFSEIIFIPIIINFSPDNGYINALFFTKDKEVFPSLSTLSLRVEGGQSLAFIFFTFNPRR